MQYANPWATKSRTVNPPTQGFISQPAIHGNPPSITFYQSPRTILSNVVTAVEQQPCLPFSAPPYARPDLIYGATPTNPFSVTSSYFQKLAPQPSSDSLLHDGQPDFAMDYLDLLPDPQQLTPPSSLDHCQGDAVGHQHLNAMDCGGQQFPRTSFGEISEMQLALNSYSVSVSENTSSYTKPLLTSPANRKASDARRRRTAKYICDMCGASLTAKHNLISHKNVHLGIKPFSCEICRKGFTAKATYRRHAKTVHRDEV